MVGRELGNANQCFGDIVDRSRRLVAITLQQAPHSRSCHQALRQGSIERRKFEAVVVDQLDRLATVGEHHHRTK